MAKTIHDYTLRHAVVTSIMEVTAALNLKPVLSDARSFPGAVLITIKQGEKISLITVFRDGTTKTQ